jgi:hypothetical protein
MLVLDIYGSTESTRVDGTGVSALLTWDSKITTVNAILGGVTDFVRQKMKADGVYTEFVDVVEVCYSCFLFWGISLTTSN